MPAMLIPWPIEIDKMHLSNHRPLFVLRPYAKISMVNVADAYPTTKEKRSLWFQPKRTFLFRSGLGFVPPSPQMDTCPSRRGLRCAGIPTTP